MDTKRLTYREWQLLSDFLDGNLSETRKLEVVEKMKSDSGFQEAYQQLVWTRHLLRNAPEHRVPHHFTLTRQMAAEAQATARPVNITRFSLRYSLASGFFALIFVVLLGVRLLPMFNRTAQTAMMESVPAAESEMAEEAAEDTMLEAMALPADAEIAEEEALVEEEPMMMMEAPELVEEYTQTATPEAAPTQTPQPEGLGGFDDPSGSGGQAATPTSTNTSIPTPTLTETIPPTLTPEADRPTAKMEEDEAGGDQAEAPQAFLEEMDTLPDHPEDPFGDTQGRRVPRGTNTWLQVGIISSAAISVLFLTLAFVRRKHR